MVVSSFDNNYLYLPTDSAIRYLSFRHVYLLDGWITVDRPAGEET